MGESMRILYIGNAMPENGNQGNIAYSVASNKMELGVLKYIQKYTDVSVITVPAMAPFPKVNKLIVNKEQVEILPGLLAQFVSFLNFPLVKQFWQAVSVFFLANKIVKHAKQKVIVLTYNAYPQIGTPTMWLSHKYCKKYAIIADLPFDDASSRGSISTSIIKLYNNITKRNLRKYDGYILLNAHATDFLCSDPSYIIMEGAIEPSEWSAPIYTGTRHGVVYSGALTDYSGVKELIEAWKLLGPKDEVLYIYGKGYLSKYVKYEAQNSKDICYMGILPNDEMREVQRKAFLLINPRNTDNPISIYTFPSKILEYMASGTPVLTTKLNGITEAYYPFLNFSSTSEPNQLAMAINDFLSTDYDVSLSKAKLGREFVLKEKSWEKQAKRVYEYLYAENSKE